VVDPLFCLLQLGDRFDDLPPQHGIGREPQREPTNAVSAANLCLRRSGSDDRLGEAAAKDRIVRQLVGVGGHGADDAGCHVSRFRSLLEHRSSLVVEPGLEGDTLV
jgi:hypothetical protein